MAKVIWFNFDMVGCGLVFCLDISCFVGYDFWRFDCWGRV